MPNGRLSKKANEILIQLRENSDLKNSIVIGKHSLTDYGIGRTHSSRYGDPSSFRYDGIHYLGKSGCKDYSRSLIEILNNNMHKISPTLYTRTNTSSPVTTQNRFTVLSEGNSQGGFRAPINA